MYYCMYFHPNVYGLKLVKHRVFFLFTIECLHLSNTTVKKLFYSMFFGILSLFIDSPLKIMCNSVRSSVSVCWCMIHLLTIFINTELTQAGFS